MITHYLNKILLPKLKHYGVSDDFCNYTLEIIEQQITSLVAHWDDIAFKKAVLLIGMEEGIFYEPSAKNDIKAFVVVTIRNSPIETMQSDSYKKTGLTKPLSTEQIKSLTADAIRYFNKQNFSQLNKANKNITQHKDYYYQVLNNHPVTKMALEKLASSSAKSFAYKPVEILTPYHLEGLKSPLKIEENKEKMPTVVFDGFSSQIDPVLCQILKNLENGQTKVFVTDSFKFVTRNFEKLVKILEFLLTRNISFATPNFYIENGCVEKRSNILKAAHSTSDLEKKLTQTQGLSYKHKTALKG